VDHPDPCEQRDATTRRVLQEWIEANARQQSMVHQIIDWLGERAHDAGDDMAYEAEQRLFDVLRALVDDQRCATAALDALDALDTRE